jgi:hypothetical protein
MQNFAGATTSMKFWTAESSNPAFYNNEVADSRCAAESYTALLHTKSCKTGGTSAARLYFSAATVSCHMQHEGCDLMSSKAS